MASVAVMNEERESPSKEDELDDFEDEDPDQDEDLPQCKIKRNYVCQECSYLTQNPRFYLHHLKGVHKHKIKIYECSDCLYASKHSQKLQRHVHMVHEMGANKKKEVTVINKPKMRPPLSSPKEIPPPAEDAEDQLDEDENFQDEFDDEDSFKDVDESECYLSEYDNGKVFKCFACPFTNPIHNLVKKHEKIQHKKKFFRCSKCNYVTHLRARYTKHVKYHSMPMIKCDDCDFKTPYKWNLDRHMKNHMGGGEFQCGACTFTADIKQSLTVHEMNHHVPPVGHAVCSIPNRRKNRVGASDSQLPEEQVLQQNHSAQMLAFNELVMLSEIEITKKPETPPPMKKPMIKKPSMPIAQFNAKELTVKIGEKVVNPGDVLQQKNGTVYIKKLKCRVCNYRAAWESEMVRHEQRVHGLDDKKGSAPKPARPIPNLIPIQNKPSGGQPVSPPGPPTLPPPQMPLVQQTPLQRPMILQNATIHHQMPSHPHFQQNLNRHPAFITQHLPPQFSQTHNLPQYPQHMPSRFAQPKHITQKVVKKPYHVNQSHQKPTPPKPSPPTPAILKIPTPTKIRNVNTPPTNVTPDKAMTEKDLNDICAKSCPNSSLKDFASLMGGDEAFKPNAEATVKLQDKERVQESGNEIHHIDDGTKSPETMKKKNSSFFDQLKEKFGDGESCNLICNLCGHESKCLSESLRHQKTHIQACGNMNSSTLFSGADLSSTRCQYCRQRCKTSTDLLMHLKSCAEANKGISENQSIEDEEDENDDRGEIDGDKCFNDGQGDNDYKFGEGYDETEGANPPHPMENKVFVWNNVANGEEDGLDDEYECGSQSPSSDCVFGIETSPGIGAVTSKNKAAIAKSDTNDQTPPIKEVKPKPDNSVKKVYKCPHCSFWASTASRFHVHIVGHLNKKPFECSLCYYRSNWRWDITKHIRLKTMRDSTHQRAKVLMTDETGRRNYSKYNKYLTLMRVHEPAADSSGSGLRGKKITQSFEPIETIPCPPKLTPAPQASDANNSMSNSSPGASQFRTIYPKPPPLQPSFDMKRKMPEESEEELPQKKKGLLENKKTMWKCKKCLFRDSDKAVVLAHVKGHYHNHLLQLQDSTDEASHSRLRVPNPIQAFKCGHCPQYSQWKHVIQRHCRLKHNGDIKVGLAPRVNNMEEPDRNEEENEPDNFMCETCPYVTSQQQSMDEHMEKHFERPDANNKCYFCPFYVADKEELNEHMSLHGEPEGEEINGFFKDQDFGQLSTGNENGDLALNRRYRCMVCPYVSNSKTQFLYHKQFHRPRGAQFQCHLCSYNVPRRHFLQQHLRLHGINTPLPKNKNVESMDTETLPNIEEIDTSNMAEIPLVWVSKLGSLTKMFKCRFCPHVNIRKSNIQEHEKMHAIRSKTQSEGSNTPPLPQQQHHCPECNYICNNAGVLSSHTKVHQGLFGQVCGLVDPTRTDEDQIKELNTLLGREEEGPPELTPDEINKDFKESSPPQLTPSVQSTPEKDNDVVNNDIRVLHFCNLCPARFLYPKELEIHLRFHNMQLQFRCDSCTYTARQQPHLLAHYKVHTDEYQDRTNALCEVYQISEEHPKPKIAIVVDGSEEVGPSWVVVARQIMPFKDPQNEYDLDEAPSESGLHGNRIITKQFSCEKCPATFFKSVALQYHLTLHGGPGTHKCRVCDYAVKTYGNLIKHESVHEDLEPRAKLKCKSKKAQDNIPTSGTELFKHKTEANQKVAATPPAPPPLHIDPEFGILMHGSPEFIYPTYLKNGRLKEKRYKCHKCPSAFEKREQYKVHLSLHGSKQRYNCERCDYSVKYYANYIQHLRKHQSNDATRAERKLSTDKSADDLQIDDGTETPSETTISEEIQPQPPVTGRSAKKMQLSMADQQTMMLMQQRVVSNSVSVPEVPNRCPHCPYTNQRKEGVGSHAKCHSNAKGGAFMCKYCDYTVPQQHFLREHNKLHFTTLKCNRPEAFMKCDRLELWSEPISEQGSNINPEDKPKRVLIFKDRGVTSKENRFLPAYTFESTDQNEDDTNEKILINIKTGQVDSSTDGSDHLEKEDEPLTQESKSGNVDSENIDNIPTEDCVDNNVDNVMGENSDVNISIQNDKNLESNVKSEEHIPMEVDENIPTSMEVDEEKHTHILEDPQRSVKEDGDNLELIEERQPQNIGTDENIKSFDPSDSIDNSQDSHSDSDNLEHSNVEQKVPVINEKELAGNELQGNSIQQSDGEESGKSERSTQGKTDSSLGSSSDTEDSSSDSSSSSGDSDDSNSSSEASSSHRLQD